MTNEVQQVVVEGFEPSTISLLFALVIGAVGAKSQVVLELVKRVLGMESSLATRQELAEIKERLSVLEMKVKS